MISCAAILDLLCVEHSYPAEHVHFGSQNYSLPDYDWLFSEFSAALPRYTYVKERRDCDFFAGEAWVLARRIHALNGKVASGFGFAMCYLTQQNLSFKGHALNLAIVRQGDKLKVVGFEPQTRAGIQITRGEEEKALCVLF